MSPLPTKLPSSRCQLAIGFTILEILVAAAVSMVLVVLLLSTAISITSNYSRAQAKITRQGDVSIALDQIVQDLEGMVIPNFAEGEGLRLQPDSVPNLDSSQSAWLTLLTTATDADNSFSGSTPPNFTGAKRAVSYRIAYQNPIDPARDSDKSYALYRSIASARHTFENIKPGVKNLIANYWNSLPATPAPTPFPPTHEEAFFAENIVGLALRFEYLNNSGNSTWTIPGDTIRIGRDGTTVNGNPIPGGFRRAEVRITALTPEGAQRVRDGVLTVPEAIEKFGKHSVRETSRF